MSCWGDHSSLYPTLPPEELQRLEASIRLRVRGDYEDALKSFERLDPSVSRLPVASIETAILYELMGLEQERLKTLNVVKRPLEKPGPGSGADEWDLLYMLRANADLYANGKLEPALSEASLAAAQLKKKRPDDFSDLEVHCALECWRIFAVSRDESNYIETEHKDILDDFPRLYEIRKILQNQGRFHLAQSLLRHEGWIEGYDTCQMLRAYEDLLEVLPTQVYAWDAAESIRNKLAFTLIFYAENLALAGKSVESDNQLEVAKQLLRTLNTYSQLSATQIPARARLLIDRIGAKLRVPTTARERKKTNLSCASKAEDLKDWPVYRVHMMAAIREAYQAREAADLRTRAAEAKDYRDILEKYLDFEDTIVRSARFLASAITEFGLALVRQGASQLEQYLDMVQAFEKDFPDFSIPKDARNMADSASGAARDLGNREAYLHYCAIERKWNERCPWMVKRSGQFVLKDDLPDEYSSSFWTRSLADPTRRAAAEIATDLILRWIRREFSQDLLTISNVEDLLQWTRLTEALAINGVKEIPKNANMDVLTMDTINHLCDILFGAQKPLENEVWEPWFSSLKSWLQLDRLPSQYQRLVLLKEVQITRYQQLSIYSVDVPFLNRLPYIQKLRKEAEKSLRLHEEIRVSDPKAVNEHELLTCKWQYAGAIKMLASTWGAKREGFLTDDLILEAINIYENLAQEYDARDELIFLHRAKNAIGMITWCRWQEFNSVNVGSCLPHFRHAEEVYRRIREQDAARSPSRALISKDMLAERLSMPFLYSIARSTALLTYEVYQSAQQGNSKTGEQSSHPDMEAYQSEVIFWCQGSKARALTDVLGLEAEIPASMMVIINDSMGAERSLAEEKTILREMNNASISQKVLLRRRLKELKDSMRQNEPGLRPVLDMRAGNPLSADAFIELAETMGKNVVIVDWVVVFGRAFDIVMLIYREGKLCNKIPLQFVSKKPKNRKQTQAHIEDWVSDSLTKEAPLKRKYDDDNDPSRELNCRLLLTLVAPLQQNTKEGEKLIFCPTRTLYRIPLHALELQGKPIIKRNPVTYIQSISLLRFCLQLSEKADDRKENVLRAVIFNTLGDDRKAEQSVQELKEILGRSATTPAQCTKKNFAELGAQADIIHVHGHILFDEKDPLPLKHRLVLGHPEEDPNNQLTADEICNITFPPGALIMAMGCNSGRTRQSDCDDLLGLTAAFHCAGAGTVVSTLWMIDADDCMKFTSAFYAYIVEQMSDGSAVSTSVDLAVAMQKGITAVRFDGVERERDPYHWAGFVLHGSWKFPRYRLCSSSI